MKQRVRELVVTLYGQQAGTIVESGGTLRFRYDTGYLSNPSATPLSLSMPMSDVVYTRSRIETFIKGLLPDNEAVRRLWATRFGVRPGDTFGLLAAIGSDAAGGALFTPEPVTTSVGSLEPISQAGIGRRLRRIARDATAWQEGDEHWSLAGAQAKFPLRKTPTGWAIPHGSEPSTHILKPGILGLPANALIEHVSMRTAGRLGLPVAETKYRSFSGQPAIVVKRFDRRAGSSGQLIRVHQEDLCQALSVIPQKKYESDGGPGVAAIVKLLREYTTDDSSDLFIQAVIVNYLLGAPDAHAKNYSVLLAGRTATLAPLYDVSSGIPYTDPGPLLRFPRAAMAIGQGRAFGELTLRNWQRMAAATDYAEEQIVAWVRQHAANVPSALDAEIKKLPRSNPHRAMLVADMLPRVRELAKVTITGLDQPPGRTRLPKHWGATHLAAVT
jgi:serine/threonine-protein kinase HipA